MAANVLFCWPDWTQPSATVTPTFTDSGAGLKWIDLGLLQSTVLSEMARCTSVAVADTKLEGDLGTDRPVRVVAIPTHSAKLGDKARFTLYTDAARTNLVLDTGWVDFFGVIYPFGSLPWGHESFATGRLSAEVAADYRVAWLYVAGAEVLGRYWRLEINASGNTDGFIDIGRLVVARGWTPKYNVSYGVQFGWRDDSRKSRSKGGAQFADKEPRRRMFRMSIDWMTLKEGFGGPLEMQRTLGTTEPFLFVFDPSDVELAIQRTCMVTASSLGALTLNHHDNTTVPIDLEEVL